MEVRMKIINFEQRSEAWKIWRNSGSGSSDIATIMGKNPYKTPYQLWEEKCGIRESFGGNRFTEHGIVNESLAREWISKTKDLQLESICVESDVNPIYKASIDGYCSSNNSLYEIKCPYTSDKIYQLGTTIEIPLMWKLQILWQAAILNTDKAYLAVWDFNALECICIECKRDPELEAKLFEEADKFWEYVKSFTPPPFQKGDYEEICDPRLHSFLLEYKKEDIRCKEATIKKKELKATIVEFGYEENFKAYGFTITRSAPRKSYDMEKMRADGIDIDKYLKLNGNGFYTIRVPKG